MTMGEKINEVLKERKMSQRDLANKIGVDETTLSRYISDSRQPRLDVLIKIARALDVSVEYLIGTVEKEDKEETNFNKVKSFVFRNASNLTDEQRMELMRY